MDDLIKRLRDGSDLSNEAADMIEDLQEIVEAYRLATEMQRNRDGYKRYLKYWREKNGRNDLWCPDGDQIYKDFWELKDAMAEIVERLEEREKTHLRVSCMCVTPKYIMQEIRIAKTYRNAIEIVKEVGGMND